MENSALKKIYIYKNLNERLKIISQINQHFNSLISFFFSKLSEIYALFPLPYLSITVPVSHYRVGGPN